METNTYTNNSFKPYIGRKVKVILKKSLAIDGTIINAKYRYGTVRFEVKPKSGDGTIWVQEKSIDFIK